MSDVTHAYVTVNDVVMMDQLPQSDESSNDAAPRAESPLCHVGSFGEAGGLEVKEHALLGHLVIRGDASQDLFQQSIHHVLGLEVPGILQSTTHENVTMCWVAPDEWLVMLPGERCFQVEQDLRHALSGHVAIVNVSGGQTVLALSGGEVTSLLKKSVPYDVDDRHFPVGKVVTSVFAKTQAVIYRRSTTEWRLVIRRSFADTVWLWLQEAALEYGNTKQESAL